MSPEHSPSILVVSASIGGGHVAAAKALTEVAQAEGLNVQHLDLLAYTAPGVRRLYQKAYFDMVRTAPDFVDWVGKRLDRNPRETRTRQERILARLTQAMSRSLVQMVKRSNPDLIVHTHFLPPSIVRPRQFAMPQVIVVTDYAAHNLWLHQGVKRYYVATPEVEAHMLAVGVDAGRIRVSGIPISPRFKRLPAKADARALLGLDADAGVLMFNVSGLEPHTLRDSLRSLQKITLPLEVIITCGRSQNLQTLVRRQLLGYQGPMRFAILGFIDDIAPYMAAADVLLGKPGGLTTSEALAAGLPFAIISPYPLQEEANANYLLENGAGFRINPLTTTAFKLERYFNNAAMQQRMKTAAKTLARPEAACAVMHSLINDPL